MAKEVFKKFGAAGKESYFTVTLGVLKEKTQVEKVWVRN